MAPYLSVGGVCQFYGCHLPPSLPHQAFVRGLLLFPQGVESLSPAYIQENSFSFPAESHHSGKSGRRAGWAPDQGADCRGLEQFTSTAAVFVQYGSVLWKLRGMGQVHTEGVEEKLQPVMFLLRLLGPLPLHG